MLSTFLSYDFEQLLIFTLLPLCLTDWWLMTWVPLVLALSIIPTGNQVSYVLPIRVSEDRRGDITLLAVSSHSPLKQFGFFFVPVAFSGILSTIYYTFSINILPFRVLHYHLLINFICFLIWYNSSLLLLLCILFFLNFVLFHLSVLLFFIFHWMFTLWPLSYINLIREIGSYC
jgi:hypothetical protein